MKDVTDGKYAGELTPEEVIEQFEYRIWIHETYAGLVLDDPSQWEAFGSYEFHMWAINGYEWGIKYIQERPERIVTKTVTEKITQVEYQCNLAEAFATISRALIKLFRR